MKTQARLRNIVFFTLLLAMLSSNVLALGIAPANKELNFEPYLAEEVRYRILNTNAEDMHIRIATNGELSNYIIFNETSIYITKDQPERYIYAKIRLPESIGQPGTHETEILFYENHSYKEQSGNLIKATTEVISTLRINVPYPDKYAEANLNILQPQSKEEVIFRVPVTNKGSLNIESAEAEIDIFDKEGLFIDTVKTDESPIDIDSEARLSANWEYKVRNGTYNATAVVTYDNKQTKVSKQFRIGEINIEIADIKLPDLKPGEISTLNIFLKSGWNEELRDVYGIITLSDKQGKELQKFKTPSTNLDPYGFSQIESYLDARELKPDEYKLKVEIHYQELVFEKQIELNLGKEKEKETPGGISNIALLALIFSALNTIILVIILYRRSKK